MKYPDDFINKVINGDCLEVMRKMKDKSVDLILTDPPYNLKKDFKNDNLTEQEFLNFLLPIFNEFARIIKDKHSVVIFFDNGQKLPLFWKTLFASNLIFQKGCQFYKPNDCSMPHNRILRKSEVFYICSSTPQLNHDGDGYMHDCIIENHTKKEGWYHPTAKNIEVIKKIIYVNSTKNQIILDPFLGSGTTAVAAKQLKRNFIGIEISPAYCKIAQDRLRQEMLF